MKREYVATALLCTTVMCFYIGVGALAYFASKENGYRGWICLNCEILLCTMLFVGAWLSEPYKGKE